MHNILLVEDEREISQIVEMYLKKEGYDYKLATNGFEALELFASNEFHLILLDIMMPGIDGFEVLKRIREVSDVPVLLVTAKHLEDERLKGFELGADDYILKPFSPRELMRRIQVFLKRVYKVDTDVIIMGTLKLYPTTMKVFKAEKCIELTSTEFDVLKALMESPNQILTREQLINLAFGDRYEGVDRNIDTYIKRVRKKIEEDPKNPKLLRTKYGKGYVFGGDDK